jgi:hypothetical protein
LKKHLTHRLLQVGVLINLSGVVYLGAAALLKTEELARAITWATARLLPGGAGGRR